MPNRLLLDEVERKEQILQELLTKAHTADSADPLQAEAEYMHALEFATETFGSRSKHAATVLLYFSAFYRKHNKPYSARHYYEQLIEIMHW